MKTEYKSADRKFNYEKRAAHIKQGVLAQKQNLDFDSALVTDIITDLDEVKQSYNSLRKSTKSRAGINISLGQYVKHKLGIETDKNATMLPLLKKLGMNPANFSVDDFDNTDGSIRQNFATTTGINPTGDFEWLVGEFIADAIRVFNLTRGVHTQLAGPMQMVSFDTIKTPIVKNPNGFMKEVGENENVRFGKIEYDEISSEVIDIAQGFSLTDKLMRNMRLNILADFISGTTGKNLDKQLTKQLIDTLINGNDLIGGTDAAPIVGVVTPGTFDYDNDILEIVIAMAQLGYTANNVVSTREGMKQIMALPEFKGFDGGTVKADSNLFVPLPSDYLFIPTGAMPTSTAAAAKLLFVDPRFAAKHYSSKALTIESDRVIKNLRTETVISMNTLFIKQLQDAAVMLDSSVNVLANPFPAALDAEVTDGTTF